MSGRGLRARDRTFRGLPGQTVGAFLALFLFTAVPAHAASDESGADPLLAGKLNELVGSAVRSATQVGVMVEDVQTGQTLYAHQADKGFNPASVTKVVTTATALKTLGPGFTFKTHLLRSGEVEQGVLKGDLVVYGEGDPSITLERLWRIASLVKVQGVREVTGDLLVDDSYFDDVRAGSGYDDFDDDKSYTAPIGAVSATWNTVAIWVKPGAKPGAPAEVSIDPPVNYVGLVDKAVTSPEGGRRRLSVKIEKAPGAETGGPHLLVTVAGAVPVDYPSRCWYRPVDDPPLYFGELLKGYLEKEGIKVGGRVRAAAVPAGSAELFTFESEPLGVIVRDLNKFSNNFTAEQILRALGAAHFGAPGTEEKGIDAIGEHLASLGIAKGSWKIENGSGLARDNQLSPRLFVKVLEAAHADYRVRGDFVASLGIAGEDGTLAHRMIGTPGQGMVRGKTGTVDGATCLAGYAVAANGHELAFAILMNGISGSTHRAMRMQDAIAEALASWNGGVAVAVPKADLEAKTQ